jgi:hypothetical protein
MGKQCKCPKIKYVVIVLRHSGSVADKAHPIDRPLTLTILSGYTGWLSEFILDSEARVAFGAVRSRIKARTNMALYM